MLYPNLQFTAKSTRPFFYTNFVATVDGKVQVLGEEQAKYWPIGSRADYENLVDLRAHADVLIHGKNTAMGVNHLTQIHQPEFIVRRHNLGKSKDLKYLIVASRPDDSLLPFIKNDLGVKALLATTTNAQIGALEPFVTVIRLGETEVDLLKLADYLFEQDLKIALVEGGPTLLGEFIKQNLMNEVFLTIAPKIFGGGDKQTLTLIESPVFPPEQVKQLTLISVQQLGNELYLRYSI